MWEKVSEYKCRGVKATSFCSQRSKISEKYDIAIFFGSHESRGLTSSQLLTSKSCKRSLIVYFDEKDNLGLRDKYDPILYSQVENCSQTKPIKIKGLKRDIEATLQRIIKKIPTENYGSDKRWFVDIVGAEKPHFFCLLGYLRHCIKCPKLTLFHPSGYYEKKTSERKAYSFTAGFDSYIWVPYFWGRPDPTMPSTYLFLLGFEGYRSYEIYDKFEPRFVKALISKPGYTPKYLKIAQRENKAFLKNAKPKMLYADAGDAVQAWKRLHDSIEKDKVKSNICIVPLGPKPHALGGGLLALSEGSASILYLIPRTYKFKDTHRGKYLWRYEISL